MNYLRFYLFVDYPTTGMRSKKGLRSLKLKTCLICLQYYHFSFPFQLAEKLLGEAAGRSTEQTAYEETDKEILPRIGSRVRRGPDWRWRDQDSYGPGTVVGHDDSRLHRLCITISNMTESHITHNRIRRRDMHVFGGKGTRISSRALLIVQNFMATYTCIHEPMD